MILQALYQHYSTLTERGVLARPGWDVAFKVSFALELDDDGALVNIIDLRTEQQKGKKTALFPRTMSVPFHATRASGISANFLCDNSSYLLGADEKGKPQRSVECFRACAALHHKILDSVDTPAARAILRYFDRWEPTDAPTHPLVAPRWEELTQSANLIFFYNSRSALEDPAIRDAWQQHYDSDDPNAPKRQCLVTGQKSTIARLHPVIKGVRDAQPSGAALVSSNTLIAPSLSSYGYEQSLNAQVSTEAAFGYAAALNYLIADREHCRTIGDTTIVCWAEHGDSVYTDAVQLLLFGPPQGKVLDDELSGLLRSLAEGQPLRWEGRELDPNEHFYFLGVSPNAARLSVRFFLQDTFGAFAEHIRRHYEDTAIVRPSFDQKETLAVWQLVNETVNQKSRDKKPSPQLAGDLFRSILMGIPYPSTLLNGVHLRIRAEHRITRGRAAIIKGYYLRSNTPCEKEVFTVELNEQSTYQPYLLGRLFSVLEALQEAANPDISATIRDKYFNSASATPASVFPLLLNLGQKHLRKLSVQQRVWHDKQITELLGQMGQTYPPRMTLPEQGAFQIGYYHQTQKRYSKKEEK